MDLLAKWEKIVRIRNRQTKSWKTVEFLNRSQLRMSQSRLHSNDDKKQNLDGKWHI